jgi:hypothetical protein
MLQVGRLRFRFPVMLLDYSSGTIALRSIQPLTEMSTWNLPRGKGRPALKADSITAICEPIV